MKKPMKKSSSHLRAASDRTLRAKWAKPAAPTWLAASLRSKRWSSLDEASLTFTSDPGSIPLLAFHENHESEFVTNLNPTKWKSLFLPNTSLFSFHPMASASVSFLTIYTKWSTRTRSKSAAPSQNGLLVARSLQPTTTNTTIFLALFLKTASAFITASETASVVTRLRCWKKNWEPQGWKMDY